MDTPFSTSLGLSELRASIFAMPASCTLKLDLEHGVMLLLPDELKSYCAARLHSQVCVSRIVKY